MKRLPRCRLWHGYYFLNVDDFSYEGVNYCGRIGLGKVAFGVLTEALVAQEANFQLNMCPLYSDT